MNATTPAGGNQPEYDTDDIDSKIVDLMPKMRHRIDCGAGFC